MPRDKPAAASPAVHSVDPTGVYTPDQFRAVFNLKATTLRREVREGRLRVARRAGRYFILGAWVLQWLEGGEVRREKRDPAAAGPKLATG